MSTQNSLAHGLRKAGHPDLAGPYARQCADSTARVLGETHPLTVHRRNNLALTLLMLRRTAEARSLLAANWAAPCPHWAIVTPGIAFLGTIAALLDGTAATDPLGRLKTLLLGPALERSSHVAHTWDVGYLLNYLRDALPPGNPEFLAGLLEAINHPTKAPALDRFAAWRETKPIARDVPWPDLA